MSSKLENEAYKYLVSQGLDQDQQLATLDYAAAHVKDPDYYLSSIRHLADFLKHPEAYQPSSFAWCAAYCHFVLIKFDKKHIWPIDVKIEDVDTTRLWNVGIEVIWGYSSTLGKQAAVKKLSAEARPDIRSNWTKMVSRGVAFMLEDWIEKR